MDDLSASPHCCTLRLLPPEQRQLADELATREDQDNLIFGDGDPTQDVGVDSRTAVMYVRKKWENGKAIRVAFCNGTATQRERVQPYFHEWSKYANITFVFINNLAEADCRVAFNIGEGSWSYLGSDCKLIPYPKPTMNFGWLKDDTDEEEYKRVVIHEVGHLLGLGHELQSPAADFEWDVPVVMAYYQGPPNNWSADTVYSQVINKVPAEGTEYSPFDRESIMAYATPAKWDKRGRGIPMNSNLSKVDRQKIASWYPKQEPLPVPDDDLSIEIDGPPTFSRIAHDDPIKTFRVDAKNTGLYKFQASNKGLLISVSPRGGNPVAEGVQQMLAPLKVGTYQVSIKHRITTNLVFQVWGRLIQKF